MAAHRWRFAALLGVGLGGSACALIIGAQELPEGSGGSSTGSSTGFATVTTSKAASSGASTSAASSSGPGPCAKGATDCGDCTTCMEQGPCTLADAGCTGNCQSFVACSQQCSIGVYDAGCVTACGNPSNYPEFPAVKACLCSQCASFCLICQ